MIQENVRPVKDRQSEDHLRTEGIVEDAQSPHPADFAQEEAIEDPSAKENVPSQVADENETMETRMDAPQFESSFGRPPLIRRYI